MIFNIRNELFITLVCCEKYIQQNADISHIYIQKIVVTIKARPTYDPVNIDLFD